jgi:predicted nucleotidyltransferase component of viral defense system
MELLKPIFKKLIKESPSKNKIFQRNILKEYLQIFVLDFIYSQKKYHNLIFYGGSCLSHCFGLPRLSEDLDFIDPKKKVNNFELAKDLKIYFERNTDLKAKTLSQKFRIYLKIPILKELGLAKKRESDFLFLKIEIFKDLSFCKKYKTEIIPLFKFNKSILVKTLDLPTLMSTKIRAIFFRKWEKIDKKGKILAKVKGRDYFDLMWYLEKGIKPNLDCLLKINDFEDLKIKLLEILEKIDSKSIRFDLEPLVADLNFVKNLSKNIKEILKREIEKLV